MSPERAHSPLAAWSGRSMTARPSAFLSPVATSSVMTRSSSAASQAAMPARSRTRKRAAPSPDPARRCSPAGSSAKIPGPSRLRVPAVQCPAASRPAGWFNLTRERSPTCSRPDRSAATLMIRPISSANWDWSDSMPPAPSRIHMPPAPSLAAITPLPADLSAATSLARSPTRSRPAMSAAVPTALSAASSPSTSATLPERGSPSPARTRPAT